MDGVVGGRVLVQFFRTGTTAYAGQGKGALLEGS